jgi:hypothetical protein
MADLTRRSLVLYDKPILDSLVNQIWNGMKRISWHLFFLRAAGPDRIGPDIRRRQQTTWPVYNHRTSL